MDGDRTEEREAEAAFSRTGEEGPLGKYDSPHIKTMVDEKTYGAWLRLCASKDRTSSALLRDVIYLLVHGETPAEMSAKNVRGLMGHQGPKSVLDRVGSDAR